MIKWIVLATSLSALITILIARGLWLDLTRAIDEWELHVDEAIGLTTDPYTEDFTEWGQQ